MGKIRIENKEVKGRRSGVSTDDIIEALRNLDVGQSFKVDVARNSVAMIASIVGRTLDWKFSTTSEEGGIRVGRTQ